MLFVFYQNQIWWKFKQVGCGFPKQEKIGVSLPPAGGSPTGGTLGLASSGCVTLLLTAGDAGGRPACCSIRVDRCLLCPTETTFPLPAVDVRSWVLLLEA